MAGDCNVLAFLEHMFAEFEARFVIALLVFIVMEKPMAASMGQQAVGMLLRIGTKPYNATRGAIFTPSIDIDLTRCRQWCDQCITLPSVTVREAGVPRELTGSFEALL